MDASARIRQLQKLRGRSSPSQRPKDPEVMELFSALQEVVVVFVTKNHLSAKSQAVLAPLLDSFGSGTWQQQTEAMIEACVDGSNEPDWWNTVLQPGVKAASRIQPYRSGRYSATSKLADLLYGVLVRRGVVDLDPADDSLAVRQNRETQDTREIEVPEQADQTGDLSAFDRRLAAVLSDPSIGPSQDIQDQLKPYRAKLQEAYNNHDAQEAIYLMIRNTQMKRPEAEDFIAAIWRY